MPDNTPQSDDESERSVETAYRSGRLEPPAALDAAIRDIARESVSPHPRVRHGSATRWASLALAAGVLVGIALDVIVLRPEVGDTQPVFRGSEPTAGADVPPEVAALPPEEWLQLIVDHIDAGDIDGARSLLDAFRAAHPDYAPTAKP